MAFEQWSMVVIIGVLFFGLFLTKLFAQGDEKEQEMTDESTNETDTFLWDNGDVKDLIEAKIKCLDYAVRTYMAGGIINDERVVKTAQKYWDFICVENDNNEQSGTGKSFGTDQTSTSH